MTIHVVTPGETIFSIASLYGVSVERLINTNELPPDGQLAVGQTIVVLFPEVTHLVVGGESLYSIAQQYEIPVIQLVRNNPSVSRNGILYEGQTLVIRYSGQQSLGQTAINGYTYPYVDRRVLRQTLPYLTYLSIFTYGFTETGALVPVEDDELIALAREYGVGPMMMLSAMTPEGHFSNELASRLFNDPALQSQVIENIAATLSAKGYVGVDVDFEYVFPEDAEAFSSFVGALSDRISPEGYLTFVALAPKTSAAQSGLLYEGHSYPSLGAEADRALLMTYEWGYTYGPPMAVSPINQVRTVLNYGVSEIPPEKIFMGISNYGYDWTLPFIPGESKAQSLGNIQAVNLAVHTGSSILFDETAQAPYFYYTDSSGREHVVWFEDARSIDARSRLVPEYGLYGMSIWNIRRFFPQSWLVMNYLFNIARFPL